MSKKYQITIAGDTLDELREASLQLLNELAPPKGPPEKEEAPTPKKSKPKSKPKEEAPEEEEVEEEEEAPPPKRGRRKATKKKPSKKKDPEPEEDDDEESEDDLDIGDLDLEPFKNASRLRALVGEFYEQGVEDLDEIIELTLKMKPHLPFISKMSVKTLPKRIRTAAQMIAEEEEDD